MSLSALSPAAPWFRDVSVSMGTILGIVFIDVVLAGDNAIVIALAVRQLKPQARSMGMVVGTGIAIVLRIALTFVASQILGLPWLKLTGALLILWIAAKLLRDNSGDEAGTQKTATNLWQAIMLIVVADLTMSLDNVLAVAGAAQGHFGLLIFGLIVSIPLVVFSSGILAGVMDRFPITVYLGAAVLGWVAGGMAVTDLGVRQVWHAGPTAIRSVEALAAVIVLVSPVSLRLSKTR